MTRASSIAGMGLSSLLLLACAGCGGSQAARDKETVPRLDGTWVRVDGTVVTAGDESFELDYGPGLITVEMDDWDWYEEGRSILPNDEVVVYGRVDNDFYERRAIEASSVYVRNLGTHFYASPADEEELGVVTVTSVDLGAIGVDGEVKSVNGRNFVLTTGGGEITVDTSALGYDPMDDQGYQKVEVGDRVYVVGRIGDTLFEQRKVVANQVISLSVEEHEAGAKS